MATLIKKPVPFFEEEYEAHSNGLIWSIKKSRYISSRPSRDGYCFNVLVSKGVKKRTPAHRVIASAFLKNNRNLPQVNHKNGIKNDNRPSNLEWCTAKENIQHGFKNGLLHIPKGVNNSMYGRFGFESNRGKTVLQLDLKTGEVLGRWGSALNAAKVLGIDNGCITACCRGESSRANKYKWVYE